MQKGIIDQKNALTSDLDLQSLEISQLLFMQLAVTALMSEESWNFGLLTFLRLL